MTLSRFLVFVGLALAVTVATGFVGVAVVYAGQLPPLNAKKWIHAGFTGGWFLLFVVQAGLARRHLRLHRRLGVASLLVAAGVIATGVSVASGRYLRWGPGDGEEGALGLFLMYLLQFALFYSIALLRRRDSELHGRFLLFAGLSLAPPATDRITAAFGTPHAVSPALVALFVLLLVGYDLVRWRRPHRATLLGVCLLVVTSFVGHWVAGSATWAETVRAWLPA
ncbi:MAG: hypothetical protein AAGC60_04285 [Acidobacteriota bacterium]